MRISINAGWNYSMIETDCQVVKQSNIDPLMQANVGTATQEQSGAKQSKVLPYIQQCIAKAFYLSSQIALIMWAKNPFIKSIALISSAAARNVLHIENHTKLNPAMKMIALRVQRHQRLTTMWSFALVQTCFMQNISIENSCNKRCAHTT